MDIHVHHHHINVDEPNGKGVTSPIHGRNSSDKWETMNVLDSVTAKSNGQEFYDTSADNSVTSRIAINASWAVNWFLLVAKLIAVILSSSKAVTAALADSAVDLVSQAVLALANRYMNKHHPNYPVGRSRLEALSVIACAFIMCMASIEVIQFSIVDLINGFEGNLPELNIDTETYIILGVGILMKLVLWLYCKYVATSTDTIEALAEDHFNDVISNLAAIITASIAFNTSGWYIDPIGAIVISLVIIVRWFGIINEQVKKIVGHVAPPEFIEKIEKLALEHDHRLQVDCTRVYHFGARFNVELEIVLPGNMTVIESHDIALELQHKIESIADVERAFVHVDHQRRDGLEHKVERELVRSSLQQEGTSSPSASTKSPELRARFPTANHENNTDSSKI